MKEISADKDLKSFREVFDAHSRENQYDLNLAETYDNIILQNLI